MRLAHRIFIRPGHEAECLALLQVDVSGVGADSKPWSRFLERIELREKFRLPSAGLFRLRTCYAARIS